MLNMQDWTINTQTKVLNLGTCSGVSQWGDHQPALGEPTKIAIGNKIVFAGAIVHPSHHLTWHRGVLMCWVCGRYASHKVVSLGKPCHPAKDAYAKHNLVKFRANPAKPPGILTHWPLPEDATPNDNLLKCLDGS